MQEQKHSSHWKMYSASIDIGGKEVAVISDIKAASLMDAYQRAKKLCVVRMIVEEKEKGRD